jgi:hypothetical protein
MGLFLSLQKCSPQKMSTSQERCAVNCAVLAVLAAVKQQKISFYKN